VKISLTWSFREIRGNLKYFNVRVGWEFLFMPVVITVQEAAQMLKLHPRTIMNMARRGEIPATKIGRQWRFDSALLENWLAERMAQNGRAQTVAQPHQQADTHSLTDLLSGCIKCVPDADSKESVLKSLAELARSEHPQLSSEQMFEALLTREKLFSTAVAGGVAFPHPRRPLNLSREPVMALLNVRNGVQFGAPDGKPTYIFVLVCSPDDGAHLRTLARLTAMFRSDSGVNEVKNCESPQQIAAVLRRLEDNIVTSTS
jgi:PTS system nitrogen regulatory IIA component